MAMITDPDDLIVGTNLSFDTSAKTFTLSVGGSLVAKDGVDGNALWSKFVDLWATSTYQPFPFPMNKVDNRSGQYVFGRDPGGSYNGWKPANDATRQMIRNSGWSEYSGAGVLNRQYVGMVGLASGFPSGAQFYYQRASGGSAINFTFTDAPNEAIQVFGDASNGNFDNRTYFKIFCREYNYTYDDAVLADVAETATGAYKIALPIAVSAEVSKIVANDATVAANAPYTGITVEFFGSDQNRTIGGGSYPFRKIIEGNGGTLEEIYTKMQYLLRQNSDIDSGAGSVIGKTADQLCYFVGDTLYTTQGVFIEDVLSADLNRVVFLDQNNVQRSYPYAAAGSLNFNANLTSGGTGYYKLYFTTLPGASNDYGESGAVVVDDNAAADISGTISGSSISFTFDYDGNVQGGRTAGTDAAVTLVAGNPGVAKPVVVTGTLTRSKTISLTATAEADPSYLV
jgi:hypothetical protein